MKSYEKESMKAGELDSNITSLCCYSVVSHVHTPAHWLIIKSSSAMHTPCFIFKTPACSNAVMCSNPEYRPPRLRSSGASHNVQIPLLSILLRVAAQMAIHSSEAVESPKTESERIPSHSMSISRYSSTDMFTTPVLGPDEGHLDLG